MKSNLNLGTVAALGLCLCAAPAMSCTIIEAFIPVPIDCIGENTPFSTEKFPDFGLQEESAETLSHNRTIVSSEQDFTKALGKDGGDSLKEASGNKINKIAREMRLSARDAAQATSGTLGSVEGVSGSYSSSKSNIENKYTILVEKGVGYSTEAKETIAQNQRVAVNTLAINGLSLASATSADVNAANGTCAKENDKGECVKEAEDGSTVKDDSVLTPKKRADEMAKAKTVQAMYEMMLIMDRTVYERSLKAASVEASEASIQAMKVLVGVSMTADTEAVGKATE